MIPNIQKFNDTRYISMIPNIQNIPDMQQSMIPDMQTNEDN
jgi:hypothetical protein